MKPFHHRGDFSNIGERFVADELKKQILARGDEEVQVLLNCVVPIEQGKGSLEIDAIVVGRYGVSVIEVKRWKGPVRFVGQDACFNGDRQWDEDPRAATDRRQRVVFSKLKLSIGRPIVVNGVVLMVPIGREQDLVLAVPPDSYTPVYKLREGIERILDGSIALGRFDLHRRQPLDPETIERVARCMWDDFSKANPRRQIGSYQVGKRIESELHEEYLGIRLHPDGRHGEPICLACHEVGYGSSKALWERMMDQAYRSYEALVRLEEIPGVARPRDFFSDPNDDCMVWTVTGRARGTPISDCGPSISVLPVLFAAAETLEACHRAGVIHRALSPESIRVLPGSGRPVVTHFDFSRVVGQATIASRIGTTLARYRYTAPEIRDAPQHASSASDVYSLGIILIELLQREKLSSDSPQEAREAAERIPHRGLRRTLGKMVEPQPDQRIQTMADLLSALKPHLP